MNWIAEIASIICISVIYPLLYNNQINARALIGQSAIFYCVSKLMKNRASSELLGSLRFYLLAVLCIKAGTH